MPTLNNYTANITLTKRTGTKLTLQTSNKYVPDDIEITVGASAATPLFDGADLSGKTSTLSTFNADLSGTDTSGVSICPQAGVTKSAARYNGAVNGWVTAADNDVIIAAETSSWTGTTQYLTGVTLDLNKTFTVTTPNATSPRVDSAIIGQDAIAMTTFTVDGNGDVTVSPPIYIDAAGVAF